MGTSVLVGLASAFALAAPAFAQDALETVTVTGYRASLQDSTNAKRASVSFSDSVFAEDIGKFPDTNIAEAFNRIPGITITRENDGSGVRVAIRGLDTNHAKVTLNGAVVSTASTGNTDAGGANREVDLNIFPIELFSKLTVDKTSRADLLEGGAAGNIDMRSARPFDNPGLHMSYNLQASDYENNGNPGGRGHLIVSDTEGPFGLLFGVSGQWNRVLIKGYEGAFNNVTTLSLDKYETYGTQTTPIPATASCVSSSVISPGTSSSGTVNTCNPVNGQNGWTLPTQTGAAVAVNAGFPANQAVGIFPTGTGVPAGYAGKIITSDLLMGLNPGLTMAQIGSSFIPRTGRPMYEKGTRNRYNAILSGEYRPTDDLHFYVDNILGVTENNLDRADMFFIGRSGNSIPMNMQVTPIDTYGDYAVTSADFANAQMALESRPYKERSFYLSINPGMEWQVTDMLHVDANINYSRAHFFRDSPTFMPTTPLGTFHYDNTGAFPVFTSALSGGFQNPANWGWNAGSRLSVAQERRSQYTKGGHINASYGGDEFKVQVGAAWDENYRLIRGYNNDTLFAEAGCNFNPTVFIPGPNTTAGCGPVASIPSSWGTYWNVTDLNGYNYPKSLGLALPVAQAPILPSSAIPQYLHAGPNGFPSINYSAMKAALNYNYYAHTPSLGAAANLQDPGHTNFSTGTNTNISSSILDEKTMGFYGEVFGTLHRGEQKLRYNVGFRWVRTLQSMTGYTSVSDPRNVWTITCGVAPYVALTPSSCATGTTTTVAAPDGTRYPNFIVPTTAKGSYSAFLPSVNLVWEVLEDFEIRAAASRTMTRANPASMLPALSGGGSGGDAYNLGNPQLKPFYSTNIDLGANLYTGGEGYIGVGIFKKMIKGFQSNYSYTVKYPWLAQYGIVFAGNAAGSSAYNNLQNLATAGGCWNTAPGAAQTLDCVNIQITQARNANGLETIKGLELNWVQPLDFMLKDYGLEGFGFTANTTWISTKTTPNSAAPSVVLNVSPMTMNLTGYYENDGVMVKVSYAMQRGTITNSNVYGIISAAPYFQSEYSMDFATVDLSSSVKLSKFFGELPTDPEFTFDVQNLFHAINGRSYKQSPKLMNYFYNGGSTFLIGIRGSL